MLKYFNSTALRIIIFCLLIPLLLVNGCSGKENAKEEQFEKIPPPLEEIETSIEKIFNLLGGPSKMEDIKDPDENQQKQAASGENNQNTDESQDQGKNESQNNQNQKAGNEEPQKTDTWTLISKEIKTIHTQWNDYMPELVKKNSDKKMIDDFSKALNDLTEISSNKNRLDTLIASNILYSNIPLFYSQYKTKLSPEVKRIIYFTRNSVLNSQADRWTDAESDINNLKSSWEMFKNTLTEEQKDDSNKINLSIYELEKVIQEHNPELADLKGRITLQNIKEIEDKLTGGSEYNQ